MLTARSLLAVTACLAATAQSFSLELTQLANCGDDMQDDSTYRFYDSLAEDIFECQNVNGPGNAVFACSQYEQGGIVGPVDCTDDGPATYSTIASSPDAPDLSCFLYASPDCQDIIGANFHLLNTNECFTESIEPFASFKCRS